MLPLRRLAGAAHPEDSPTQGRWALPNLPAGAGRSVRGTRRRGVRSGRVQPSPAVSQGTLAGRSGQPAGLAASGELVVRVVVRGLVLDALAGQQGQLTLDLAPHASDGDAEDALSTLDEVDDLVGGRALVDGGAVAHEGDLGEVLDTALAQVADGDADLLEGDPGVEQALDDLEDEDVAETVETLGARSGGAAHRRLHESGAGPVVELAVGDAGGPAGRRAAVAAVLVELGQVVGEQQALGPDGHGPRGVARVLDGGHAVLLLLMLRAAVVRSRRRQPDNYNHVVLLKVGREPGPVNHPGPARGGVSGRRASFDVYVKVKLWTRQSGRSGRSGRSPGSCDSGAGPSKSSADTWSRNSLKRSTSSSSSDDTTMAASSRMADCTTTFAPVRRASAMASLARELTSALPSMMSAAWKTESLRATIRTSVSSWPSTARTSRIRSCVSGLGGTTPCWAYVIAAASAAP